jgi:hypothetical protein
MHGIECLTVSFISTLIKSGFRNFKLTPFNITSFLATTCKPIKNGGKNSRLGIEVLYRSDYSTQIGLMWNFPIRTFDCEINLLILLAWPKQRPTNNEILQPDR